MWGIGGGRCNAPRAITQSLAIPRESSANVHDHGVGYPGAASLVSRWLLEKAHFVFLIPLSLAIKLGADAVRINDQHGTVV